MAAALIDKGAELGAEEIGEPAAGRGRQPVQQGARRLVGGENAAILVHRQKPGAQRVQILASVMEGDQRVAAVALAEKAVFDLRGRHGHQRLGVGLARQAVG